MTTTRTYTITAWKEPPVYAQIDIEAASADEALAKANDMMAEIDHLDYGRCAFDDDGMIVELRAHWDGPGGEADEKTINLDPVIDDLRETKRRYAQLVAAVDTYIDLHNDAQGGNLSALRAADEARGELARVAGCVKDEKEEPLSDEERFPKSDWQYEVSNGDTALGYVEWVAHRKEAEDAQS